MPRSSKYDKMSGDLFGIIIALPIIIVIFFAKLFIMAVEVIIKLISYICNSHAINKLFKTNIQKQLSQLDELDGIQFENYIGLLLQKSGYKNVIVTRASGDFGADIIAEKDGEKYAIQCKRYSKFVGPKPIGEVLRGMNRYKCGKGIVITNNYFTKQAIEESKISHVELWDRKKLVSVLKAIQD